MSTIYHFAEILDRFDEKKAFSFVPSHFKTKSYTVEREECIKKYFEIETNTKFNLVFEFRLGNNSFSHFDFYLDANLLLANKEMNKTALPEYVYVYLPKFMGDFQMLFDYVSEVVQDLQNELQKQPFTFDVSDNIADMIEKTYSISSSERQKALSHIEQYETKHHPIISKKIKTLFEKHEKEEENKRQRIRKEISKVLPEKQIEDIKKAIDKALDDRDEEQFVRLQQQLKNLQQDN